MNKLLSSCGKARLGRITKVGNGYIRSLLVGCTSGAQQMKMHF
ncbi:IS110 family transposase [Gallionella capsiferriformans]|nr:IS110 family transposase [Gallionella capsiferriformans]